MLHLDKQFAMGVKWGNDQQATHGIVANYANSLEKLPALASIGNANGVADL